MSYLPARHLVRMGVILSWGLAMYMLLIRMLAPDAWRDLLTPMSEVARIRVGGVAAQSAGMNLLSAG